MWMYLACFFWGGGGGNAQEAQQQEIPTMQVVYLGRVDVGVFDTRECESTVPVRPDGLVSFEDDLLTVAKMLKISFGRGVFKAAGKKLDGASRTKDRQH